MIYALFSLCILASGLSFTFGYLEGKRRGYSQGYSEAEDVWKETALSIEKTAEDRIDIYKEEMTEEKNRYHELCEKHYDDLDANCSGILETEDFYGD